MRNMRTGFLAVPHCGCGVVLVARRADRHTATMHFAYVKIPMRRFDEGLLPAVHERLEQQLAEAGAGSLLGWGTSLPTADARADDPGRFHRLDLGLRELDAGLDLLRRELSAMQLPYGTELHYRVGASAREQMLEDAGWSTEVADTTTRRPLRA